MLASSPGFITVETVMFFGLGFLIAVLLMLAFMPAVHDRAVRLTRRKYQPVPLEQKEMHAEKDRLRADFAMSTRKLEHEIDKMQRKAAAQFTEIARRNDTIAQLRETLDARDTLIAQLQAHDPQAALAGGGIDSGLQALKADHAAKTGALNDANQRIVTLMAEVAALTAALDRRIHLYDTQQHEIMTLTGQSDVLRMQLAALAPVPHQPSPAFVPAERGEIRVETGADGDVIRRALEAIAANGEGNGHSMPGGWISAPSHGAVPFGH
jgi:hypothetical protein